ncbi:MAG TPA: hypothetical protein VKA67_12330 [Verrucomicrobiae bacterium]|nr:hypothetical protein [Verrucomicrobiae bacterium]
MPKGSAYEVQASNDLKLWNAIGQGIAKDLSIEVLDSLATNYNQRFYRVIANDVPSSNVVGYASITLPPRFSMIGNPFDATNNSVGELFKDWPDNTTLNRFDTRLFRLMDNMVKDGKWMNPADRLLPGHGAIFSNPTLDYRSLNFAGEVMQGNLSIPIPSGFSIRSSIVPQSGQLVDDLGFPIADGDVVHIFDREKQDYVLYPYENGEWKSGQPMLGIGESFWVAKTVPGNWNRSFFVNE